MHFLFFSLPLHYLINTNCCIHCCVLHQLYYMGLENQVVQIQIQYHKAFQIIWETVVMISGVSYQYQKPLTIYLQTKSFTKNATLLMKK